MLLPVCKDIAAIQVRLPAFLQTDRYTDGEREGKRGRERERKLSTPVVSPSSCECFSPPTPILRLPLGIECSQTGRWAECIIHALFWGAGGARACVRTKSWGSRLWSHYRSNGGVSDAVSCQSHLKCKSQMSVKRFINHAPPQCM